MCVSVCVCEMHHFYYTSAFSLFENAQDHMPFTDMFGLIVDHRKGSEVQNAQKLAFRTGKCKRAIVFLGCIVT